MSDRFIHAIERDGSEWYEKPEVDARIAELKAALAERDADLRGFLEDVRTYHVDCSCYACQRRRVIADEMTACAEEGSEDE